MKKTFPTPAPPRPLTPALRGGELPTMWGAQVGRAIAGTNFLAALLLATAACGAYQFPSGGPAATGTVSGTVISLPCSPIVVPDNPCAGWPVPGAVLTFTKGTSTATTTTDKSGAYSIELEVGTWNVNLKGFQYKGYQRIVRGPRTVKVTADANVVANYVIDSGIRVPQPVAQA